MMTGHLLIKFHHLPNLITKLEPEELTTQVITAQ